MAKKSIIARDLKRHKLINRYAAKRAELKAAGDWQALHLLPPNSCPSRRKNRCQLSGRPRAYMRRFGLSRIAFREQASSANIPGITKSSW